MLLHGVIDSPDIPLNVSRSFLQADSNVKKINTYITKKVADKLNELYKNDRVSFENKWDDIGLFVKYGMVTDEKFYEKAKDFCLLTNVENKHFNFEEYREKVNDIQTDKSGTLVYLYTIDAPKQDTYIQSAQKKSYDVLKMEGPLDPHFISYFEQKSEKLSLKRVDADVLNKLIEKDEQQHLVLNDDEKNKVKDVFAKAVNKPNMQVEVEAHSTDDMPVTVTMDEFMRRMKEMSKMGGQFSFYGMMPDNYKLSVNGNHKLINRILQTTDEDQQQALAKHAIDLALLSQGMLTGAYLTAFVNRSVSLV
jgi:molecular chaperone HtpG